MNDVLANAQGTTGLKRKSVQGSAAALAAQAGTMVVSTVTTMALARLLAPSDFGLIAMAAIVMNLAVLFQNIGLDTATVRAKALTQEQVSTLFWINLGIGALLMLLVIGCAPLAAAFFRRSDLAPIVMALGPSFLFSGAMLQHRALLQRRMLFTRLAAVTIVAQVLAAGAAILVAWLYHTYWALVVQRLAQSLTFAAAVWLACPWLPSRPVRAAGLRSMLAFGGHLTGSRLVEFVMRNFDNLLIGRFINETALGFYDKAYALLLLPIRQLNQPLTAVVTPGLARVIDDPPRFVAYYVRALNTLVLLSMPLVVFSALAAPEIIGIVLGPGWDRSLTLFLCLAPAAFLGTFNVATGWVYVTLGRTDRQLRMSLATAVVGVAALALGVRWGTVGVACAVSTIALLCRGPQLLYCFRGTPVKMRDFLRAVARPAAASLGAGVAAVLLVRWVLPSSSPLLVSGAVKTVLYGALYPGLYLLLPGGRAELRRGLAALRELKPAGQPAKQEREQETP